MGILSDMPLGGLFILMLIPLICAILLVGYIVFAVNRRKKKAGVNSAVAPIEAEAPTFPDAITNPAPAHVDMSTAVDASAPANPETLFPDVEDTPPNTVVPATAPQKTAQISQSLETRLNMALLSKDLDMEDDAMPDTPPPQTDNVDAEATPISPPAGVPPNPEPVELLRLLRDSQSGQLIVEVGRQRYTKLADISDKKIGQYILRLAAHLLAFTNGVILTNAGMKSMGIPTMGQVPEPIAPPRPTPAPASPPVSPPVPPAPPQVEAEFLASLRAQTAPGPQSKPQSRGFLGLGKVSSEPPPAVPSLNLADEINEIVQNRLRYSPLASTTQIEITSDPGGGIRIQVNNQFYSSPDDVPDQAARDLIKEAIKEWEKS